MILVGVCERGTCIWEMLVGFSGKAVKKDASPFRSCLAPTGSSRTTLFADVTMLVIWSNTEGGLLRVGNMKFPPVELS